MASHVFTDELNHWYAAVEPGYNARRRARYAIRQALLRDGWPLGSERLTIEPARGYENRPQWREYDVWCTTSAFRPPGR